MYPVALLLVIASIVPTVHAADKKCIATADAALARVAKTLGLGNGVGHLGGSEVTARRTLGKRGIVLTIGGGMLAAADGDCYLTGTAATVEVVALGETCTVSSISINTGADHVAGE